MKVLRDESAWHFISALDEFEKTDKVKGDGLEIFHGMSYEVYWDGELIAEYHDDGGIIIYDMDRLYYAIGWGIVNLKGGRE